MKINWLEEILIFIATLAILALAYWIFDY